MSALDETVLAHWLDNRSGIDGYQPPATGDCGSTLVLIARTEHPGTLSECACREHRHALGAKWWENGICVYSQKRVRSSVISCD